MSTSLWMSGLDGGRVLAEGSVGGGEFVCLEAEGDWPSLALHLHPEEATYAAARFGLRRRLGWAAGRFALRRAMHRVGIVGEGAILATPRGAPSVAAQVSGSISHKGGVAAGFASVVPGCHVGIDMERLLPERMRISTRVLTDRESLEVARSPVPNRWQEVLVRFCVKEAVFKAVDPLLRRPVDFTEVEVSGSVGQVSIKHAFAVGGRALSLDVYAVRLPEHLLAFATARLL